MFPDISNPTLSGKIVFLWRIINFQKIYSEERYILDISTHRRLIDWSPLRCTDHRPSNTDKFLEEFIFYYLFDDKFKIF